MSDIEKAKPAVYLADRDPFSPLASMPGFKPQSTLPQPDTNPARLENVDYITLAKHIRAMDATPLPAGLSSGFDTANSSIDRKKKP